MTYFSILNAQLSIQLPLGGGGSITDATFVERPNRFVVLPGHIIPEVEVTVADAQGYVVVEKIAVAGDVAETLDPRGI